MNEVKEMTTENPKIDNNAETDKATIKFKLPIDRNCFLKMLIHL